MQKCKALPAAIEAEQSVLGSMMMDADALKKGCDLLTAEDFIRFEHGIIFGILAGLHENNSPADILLVQQGLLAHKKLDTVGGIQYLASLIDSIATTANTEYHAEVVKKKALLRRLIDETTKITATAYTCDEEDIPAFIAQGADRLVALANTGVKRGYQSIFDHAWGALDTSEFNRQNRGAINGVPTGLASLNRKTQGWQNGDLIIWAAQSSHGKTAEMLDIAQAGSAKTPVGIFSLEMTGNALATRMIAQESRVRHSRIRAGQLDDTEWDDVTNACQRICNKPIYICDDASITISEIPILARKMKSERDIGLIMVDYIGIIGMPGETKEHVQATESGRMLKRLARELNIPVIGLCQMNRNIDYRPEQVPKLSDLRYSASLGHDADLVIFIHNPRLADDPDGLQPRKAQIIIEKARNAPTGTIDVWWVGDHQRFYDQLPEGMDEPTESEQPPWYGGTE